MSDGWCASGMIIHGLGPSLHELFDLLQLLAD